MKKLTYQEVKSFFDSRGFTLISPEYKNSETPMVYLCSCGKQSQISYKNARKGRNCKSCGLKKLSKAKQIYKYEFIYNFFSEQGCKLVSKKYNADPHEKLEYLCKCGNKSSISWSDFKDGHRCKSCSYEKAAIKMRKYTIEDVRELFILKDKVLLEKTFINSLTPMRYTCSCGSESEITLNNFLKGKDCYTCRNKKISEAKKDPNIQEQHRIARRSNYEYRLWRQEVYRRDSFTCRCCSQKSGEINAHHILNFLTYKPGRYDIDNGITLCGNCHREFHQIYGVWNNDEVQLKEFFLVKNGGGE